MAADVMKATRRLVPPDPGGVGGSTKVLLSDGGDGQNRSTLAAVRALHAAGYRPTVTVSAPYSLAAASRWCAGVVPVPSVREPGYPGAVAAELAREPCLAVLPASDAAMVALGATGTDLIDKTVLAARARRAGLAVPDQRVFPTPEHLAAAAADLAYPVVVKPALRISGAQPPARRVDSATALRALPLVAGELVVQPVLPGRMHALSGVVWEGRLAAVVSQRYLRLWPVESGVACAAVTVEGDRELEERVLQVLEGYTGLFQAQFLGGCLIDVNPRVYGSLPLAVAAGANLPAVHCDLLRGRGAGLVRGRAGVRYRWLEGDLRHVMHAWRTGQSTAMRSIVDLLPRPGTAHSTETLRDPGPAIVRLQHGWRSRHSRRSRH